MSKADVKLAMIPLIFVLLRMWGTIEFFWSMARGGGTPPFWILILMGVGDSAQGFANCILFCVLTEKVRMKFVRCFSFKRAASEEEEEAVVSEEEKAPILRKRTAMVEYDE